jgi:hypothetical protein
LPTSRRTLSPYMTQMGDTLTYTLPLLHIHTYRLLLHTHAWYVKCSVTHNTVNFKWVSFPPYPSLVLAYIHTRVATCMYSCSYTCIYASLYVYVYLAFLLFGNYVCDPPYTQLPTLLPSCMHVGCVSVHTLSRTSRGGEETRGEGQ